MSVSGRAWKTSEELRRYQQHSLAELLRHAWERSAFYRDYYSSHGLRKSDLPEISVTDLPLVSKKL